MFLCAQGCVLAWPSSASVGPPPVEFGSQAREVTFPSGSGAMIRAWFIPGTGGVGGVLLLHGVGDDRRAMLGRARFLHDAGFTILAPDFQGAGESPGRHVTFGELESLDARAALEYLRNQLHGERVAVIGVSMGGAASLVGPKPLPADALVLEAVYPTLRQAVRNRLQRWLGPFGFLGRPATPVLISLVGPEIGIDEDHLRPIDAIAKVDKPLLLIAGTKDPYTPLGESRELFAHARAPKELWELAGAGHEDFYAFAPREYERRVGDFLRRALSPGQGTN